MGAPGVLLQVVLIIHPPRPPKEPKIMALYPKIVSISSIGSIILDILEVQADALGATWMLGGLANGATCRGVMGLGTCIGAI